MGQTVKDRHLTFREIHYLMDEEDYSEQDFAAFCVTLEQIQSLPVSTKEEE